MTEPWLSGVTGLIRTCPPFPNTADHAISPVCNTYLLCISIFDDGINSRHSRRVPHELHDKTRRLLDQLNAAPSLAFFRIPPSNRLEKLRGDLAGYWSLRINERWRIIFRWEGNDAADVEIINYHR